jgi:anthranilate phosphoribosyltransferase
MTNALAPLLQALHARTRPATPLLEPAFAAMLRGEASDAQIGACLMGLEWLGPDTDLLVAGARAMRAAMTTVAVTQPCIDVCGTGGDGAHTLNVSTAVSFVLAGCGLHVAKHGNRAMSSKSGAADVLEALGVNLGLDPGQAATAIDTIGIAFLFAQAHHPAMAHVGPVRRALGFRTIFNLLGPLCNPAGATFQLLGVATPDLLLPMAHALRALGCEAAWVVHGDGGIDEIALSGPTRVAALSNGAIDCFDISPEDAGLSRQPLSTLRGGDAATNAQALRALLMGVAGPYRDCVCLNAAAALVLSGRAEDLVKGVALAGHAIDSGAALGALTRLVAFSNGQLP